MGKTVEFFFDFMSPPSFLAYRRLPAIAARTDADIVWKPMYTIGLHQIVGNQSPVMVPAKGAWIAKDLERFARRHAIDYRPNPHQPVKVVPALRGALVAHDLGGFGAYVEAVFAAMWEQGRNIGDPDTLFAIVGEAGLDAEAIRTRIDAPEIKARLVANTEEAAERGAFGAPSFFVDGELYWGQDRLDFVEEALQAN